MKGMRKGNETHQNVDLADGEEGAFPEHGLDAGLLFGADEARDVLLDATGGPRREEELRAKGELPDGVAEVGERWGVPTGARGEPVEVGRAGEGGAGRAGER